MRFLSVTGKERLQKGFFDFPLSSPLLLLFALVLFRVGGVAHRGLRGGAAAYPDRARAHAAAAALLRRRLSLLVELDVQAGRHLLSRSGQSKCKS